MNQNWFETKSDLRQIWLDLYWTKQWINGNPLIEYFKTFGVKGHWSVLGGITGEDLWWKSILQYIHETYCEVSRHSYIRNNACSF